MLASYQREYERERKRRRSPIASQLPQSPELSTQESVLRYLVAAPNDATGTEHLRRAVGSIVSDVGGRSTLDRFCCFDEGTWHSIDISEQLGASVKLSKVVSDYTEACDGLGRPKP